MTELHIAHTADLGADQKAAIRGLMDAVFDGVSDDTFDNTLGGVHALVLENGELIGHGSVVQRRLLHAGRTLRTGSSPDGARLYASRGWQLWRGPSSAMTPDGIRPTPGAEEFIYVLPVSVPVDVSGELTCDWRPASLW